MALMCARDQLADRLCAGQRQHVLPAGSGRRIPAGSKFVFQMHYTPNGTPQQDLTKVGMLFVDKEDVKNEVITLMAINQEFEIPPQVADYPVVCQAETLAERWSTASRQSSHARAQASRLNCS